MSANARNFLPFYERIAKYLPGYVASRVIASALLGLVFFIPHSLLSPSRPDASDWSWFLALLISVAMLCLYYATHTLDALSAEFNSRASSDEVKAYKYALSDILSDRKFIQSGLFFGGLNCAVGLYLGLPSNTARATILFGYFLAGFVGGMAVWGIYGVTKLLNAFSSKAKSSFDFTSPDGCGGTGFVGDALIVFSSVFLVVGVMISIYMLRTAWTSPGRPGINLLRGFWIFFPYLCSFVALAGPAIPVARELKRYKIEQELSLQHRLKETRGGLDDPNRAADRKDLREQHDDLRDQRKVLYAMRTWPFSLGANLKYFGVLAVNVSAHVSGATKLVQGWFGAS
jgi:hypothetical protein